MSTEMETRERPCVSVYTLQPSAYQKLVISIIGTICESESSRVQQYTHDPAHRNQSTEPVRQRPGWGV